MLDDRPPPIAAPEPLSQHVRCPRCGLPNGAVATNRFSTLTCFCPACEYVWLRDNPAERPRTMGRPSVLWQGEPAPVRTQCLASLVSDGRYRVWVVRDGAEQSRATFDTAAEGIRWAFDVERGFAASEPRIC